MSGAKNWFFLLATLLLLLLLLSISANVRFLLSSRASGASVKDFSTENSYLFISPVEAKADQVERIRLTVFILNDQGRGISGKKVSLNTAQELLVEPVQEQTDTYGRAIFDVLTNKAGIYSIEALVEEIKVGESISLSFN